MNTIISGIEVCDDVLINIVKYISLGDLSTSICLVNSQFAKVICPIIQKERYKFKVDINIRHIIEFTNFLNLTDEEDKNADYNYQGFTAEIRCCISDKRYNYFWCNPRREVPYYFLDKMDIMSSEGSKELERKLNIKRVPCGFVGKYIKNPNNIYKYIYKLTNNPLLLC